MLLEFVQSNCMKRRAVFSTVSCLNECTPAAHFYVYRFWENGGKTKKSRQPKQRVCIQFQYYCKDLFETQGYARASHIHKSTAQVGERYKKFNKERVEKEKNNVVSSALRLSLSLLATSCCSREVIIYWRYAHMTSFSAGIFYYCCLTSVSLRSVLSLCVDIALWCVMALNL